MHYKDGKEAKVNDLIICVSNHGTQFENHFVGILVTASSASPSCNGSVLPLAQRQKSDLGFGPWLPLTPASSNWSVTIKECYKIDELPQT